MRKGQGTLGEARTQRGSLKVGIDIQPVIENPAYSSGWLEDE